MPLRAYYPFQSLAAAWEVKVLFAFPTAWLLNLLAKTGDHFAQLLAADPLLIIAIVFLLGADMLTGIGASLKRGQKVSSKAFRRTGWKVLEYTALATVGIVLANAFSDSSLHAITDSLDDAALLYIAMTEAMSVLENVTGSRTAAKKLWSRVLAVRRAEDGTLEIEQIVESEPITPDRVSAPVGDPAPPLPDEAGRIASRDEPEPPPIIPPTSLP